VFPHANSHIPATNWANPPYAKAEMSYDFINFGFTQPSNNVGSAYMSGSYVDQTKDESCQSEGTETKRSRISELAKRFILGRVRVLCRLLVLTFHIWCRLVLAVTKSERRHWVEDKKKVD
jgi:hypothetical protein